MGEKIRRIYEKKLMSIDNPDAAYNGFNPSKTLLKKGYVHMQGHRALGCNILWERDTEFIHSDSTKIYMDIFRPESDSPVPAIIVWSPYGKCNNNQPWSYKSPKLSMLQREEGPDPAFWCEKGYAVINPDPRGSYMSEGIISMWGDTEGKDIAEIIEWAAAQSWCNGKIGLAGNSWLATSQWFAAAENPPHLAAIAPWEGQSDLYRNSLVCGGIPDLEFPKICIKARCGNAMDDAPAMAEAYPLWNEYWESKRARLENINVPAYIVASYTNGIHADGTFSAYRRISSDKKWLRIHNTSEWPDFYDNQEDLRKFFDYYLMGKVNGWEETPRVRMSLLNPGGDDIVERPEKDFPPEGVKRKIFYLSASDGSLSENEPDKEDFMSYDSENSEQEAVFDYIVDKKSELAGYMKLELYVESEHDDMDLFVIVGKADENGENLIWSNSADPYTRNPFLGFKGRLRVSLRKLSDELSKDEIPVQSFDEKNSISKGETVKVEMAIWPAGMVFEAGQRIRLRIKGSDFNVAQVHGKNVNELPLVNKGMHKIHTGGRYKSKIYIPLK